MVLGKKGKKSHLYMFAILALKAAEKILHTIRRGGFIHKNEKHIPSVKQYYNKIFISF